jgi:hypothetical protein
VDLNQDENALLEHLREAREKGETTAPKAEELGVGVDGAYRVQAALREGREVVGYKLGHSREITIKPGRREAVADQEDGVIDVALDVDEGKGVV